MLTTRHRYICANDTASKTNLCQAIVETRIRYLLATFTFTFLYMLPHFFLRFIMF
jgi:hypothetical protein